MRAPARRRLFGLAMALLLAVLGAEPAFASPEMAEASPEPATVEPDPLYDDDFDEEFEDEFTGRSDPTRRDSIEGFNRAMFAVNEGIDRVVWKPATWVYRLIVPGPARRGIYRVFLNINSPSILLNKIFQGKFKDAGKVFGRLLLNSTVGWGGLFDPAVEAGWEYQRADFGQSLAYAGVPSGGYLVLPIFGPSNYRDGFGTIADQFMQPTLYFLGPWPHIFMGTGFGFVVRESLSDEIQALRDSSIDYYSALRSVYWQHREAELGLTGPASIGRGRPNPEPQDSSADPEASLAILSSSADSSPSIPSR
jgi:phospholipid-binding lipoprotein MlaA